MLFTNPLPMMPYQNNWNQQQQQFMPPQQPQGAQRKTTAVDDDLSDYGLAVDQIQERVESMAKHVSELAAAHSGRRGAGTSDTYAATFRCNYNEISTQTFVLLFVDIAACRCCMR